MQMSPAMQTEKIVFDHNILFVFSYQKKYSTYRDICRCKIIQKNRDPLRFTSTVRLRSEGDSLQCTSAPPDLGDLDDLLETCLSGCIWYISKNSHGKF